MLLPCEQRFLSCMALSVYDEVFRVVCQSRSWFVFMQEKNFCSQGNLSPFRCELEHFSLYGKARLTVKSPVAQFISVKWFPEMMTTTTTQSPSLSIPTGMTEYISVYSRIFCKRPLQIFAFWVVAQLEESKIRRIKPRGNFPNRGPDITTFWRTTYGMQF